MPQSRQPEKRFHYFHSGPVQTAEETRVRYEHAK